MIRKLFAVSMVFCLVIILAGCATIIHGRMQQVSVATTPSGAFVTATGGQQITTPGVLTLDRGVPAHILHVEKQGYEPIDIKLKRGFDGWLLGNILIGGIPGIIIDFVSGSAYAIYPSQVDTVLKAKGISMNMKNLDMKKNLYIVIDLAENYPEIDLSKLEKIN